MLMERGSLVLGPLCFIVHTFMIQVDTLCSFSDEFQEVTSLV